MADHAQHNDAPARRPRIGISMGDPAGIGPEVICKALNPADPATKARRDAADYVIYGAAAPLLAAAHNAGIEPFWWRARRNALDAAHLEGQHVLLVDGTPEHMGIDPDELDRAAQTHEPTRTAGAASYAWVEDAIADALAGAGHQPTGSTHSGSLNFGTPITTDAVVTAPIAKAAWALAGIKRFPGHTELLAERTGAKRARMLFVMDELKVILVTTHIPLASVPNTITIGRVTDTIDLAREAMALLGNDEPTIAVAGINPHAGEDGLLGDDEQRVVTPAIKLARGQGIDAVGPVPGDTVVLEALRGRADIVVAMYHDQGLAPVKALGFDRAVNATIGLPIVRTSPDHGTAYNIAGTNSADPGSMNAAIDLAIRFAHSRNQRAAEQATT